MKMTERAVINKTVTAITISIVLSNFISLFLIYWFL